MMDGANDKLTNPIDELVDILYALLTEGYDPDEINTVFVTVMLDWDSDVIDDA